MARGCWLAAVAAVFGTASCAQAPASAERSAFSKQLFELPQGENALHAGDLNGDGLIDLISASEEAGTVTVRLGDGLGGFADGTEFSVDAMPTSIDSAPPGQPDGLRKGRTPSRPARASTSSRIVRPRRGWT